MPIPEVVMGKLIIMAADIGSDIAMDLYQRAQDQGGTITAEEILAESNKWEAMKIVQDQRIRSRQMPK